MHSNEKKQFSGVSWHVHRKAWRVGFRFQNVDVYFGCFRDLDTACWVSDFARYLLFGLNPANWHVKVGRPNAPPHLRDDFPRVLILRKISDLGVLSQENLSERLAAFDAACSS
jgi:hypothetical protein